MPSTKPFICLSTETQNELLGLARQAILHGLSNEDRLPINLEQLDPSLTQHACCFVTLHKSKKLRGCMGALTATQALAKDLIEHAYAAAFLDPRFARVTTTEVPQLHIEISILTPTCQISFQSEADLLDQLKPDVDGLVLEDKHYQATFLPSVWKTLPDKRRFLSELKYKAGMPANYWSDTLKAYRYHTIVLSE